MHHHRAREAVDDGKRTSDAKEYSSLPQTTTLFVSVLQHLEHRSHLFSAVYCFILNYVKSILRSSINFDDAMTRVGRVRRDDEEAQSILVQDKLVEGQGVIIRT